MAKVLACPACGNKHPLELLAGLDSFLCKQCGKKLAVPSEAISATTPNSKPDSNIVAKSQAISEPETANANAKPNLNVESVDEDEVAEIQVVARSSMAVDSVGELDQTSDQKLSEVVAKSSSPQNAQVDGVKADLDQTEPSGSKPEKNSLPIFAQSGRLNKWIKSFSNLQNIHIPLLGRSLAWILAVPTSFFLVVLLPRFFGYGFHASDFVGVITYQGIGRYKIVVALIFFWSVTTVVCVSLFNSIIRKLFLAKKLAT